MSKELFEKSVECPICEGYNTKLSSIVENGHKILEGEYCCYDCNLMFAKSKRVDN